MTTIEVQLPRLLQGTTRGQSIAYNGYAGSYTRTETVVDFSTKAVLRPIKLGVKLSYDTLSKATLTMPESDDVLKMHDFVELYSDRGSLGIFRVVSSGLNPMKNRTYSLNHAYDTFNDCVIGHIAGGSTADGTESYKAYVRDLLLTVMSFQQSSSGRCYWQLGTVDSSVANQWYEFNNSFTNAKSVLDAIAEKYTECVYTFDFTTTPWTLNFVKRETATRTELRLNRNISGIDINRSDTDQCTRLYLSIDSYTDPFVAEESKGVTYQQVENPEAQAKWGIISKAVGIKTEEVPSPSDWIATFWKLHADPQLDISITAQDYSKYSGEPMDAFWLGSMCRVILADYDGDDREYDERIMQMDNDDVLNKPLAWKLALSNKRKTAGGSIAKAREKTESAANTARSASIRRGGGGGSGSSSGNAITNVRITGPENNVYTLQYYKNGVWNNAETTFSRATNLIGGYHIGGGGLVDVYNWIDPDSHPGYLKVMADPQGNTKTFVISPAGSPVAHWGDGHSVDPATGQTESRTTYYSKINVIDGDSYSVIGTVRNFQVDASGIINLGDIEWMAFNDANGLPSHRVGTWAVYASQSDAENGSNALRSKSKEFFLTQGLDGDKPVVFLRPGSASANPVAKLEVEGVVGSGAVDGIQVGAPNVGSYSNGTIPIEFSVSAYEILDGVDEDEDGNDDMNVIYSMNPSPVFTLPISHSLTLDENTSTATVTGDLTTTLSRSSFTTDQTIGYVSTALSYQSASTFRVTSALTSGQNGSGTKYGVAATDIELRASSVPGNSAAMRFGAYVGNTAWAPQTITLSGESGDNDTTIVKAMIGSTAYAQLSVSGSGGAKISNWGTAIVSGPTFGSGNINLTHRVTAYYKDGEGDDVAFVTESGVSNPRDFALSFPWYTKVSTGGGQATDTGNGILTYFVRGGTTDPPTTIVGRGETLFSHMLTASTLDSNPAVRVQTSYSNDGTSYYYLMHSLYKVESSHALEALLNSGNYTNLTLTSELSVGTAVFNPKQERIAKLSFTHQSTSWANRVSIGAKVTNDAGTSDYARYSTYAQINPTYTPAAAIADGQTQSIGAARFTLVADNEDWAYTQPNITLGGGDAITTNGGTSEVTFSMGSTVLARKLVTASIQDTTSHTYSGAYKNSNGTWVGVGNNGTGRINFSGEEATAEVRFLVDSVEAFKFHLVGLYQGGGSSEPTTHVYSGAYRHDGGNWIGVGNNGTARISTTSNEATAEVRFLVDSVEAFKFNVTHTFSGSGTNPSTDGYADGWADARAIVVNNFPRSASSGETAVIKLPTATAGSTAQDTVVLSISQGVFGGDGLPDYQKYVYIRNSTDGVNIARAIVNAQDLAQPMLLDDWQWVGYSTVQPPANATVSMSTLDGNETKSMHLFLSRGTWSNNQLPIYLTSESNGGPTRAMLTVTGPTEVIVQTMNNSGQFVNIPTNSSSTPTPLAYVQAATRVVAGGSSYYFQYRGAPAGNGVEANIVIDPRAQAYPATYDASAWGGAYITMVNVSIADGAFDGGGSGGEEPTTHVYSATRQTKSGSWMHVPKNGSAPLNIDGASAYTAIRFIADGEIVYSFNMSGTFDVGDASSSDYALGWADAFNLIQVPASDSTNSYATFKLPTSTPGTTTTQRSVTLSLSQDQGWGSNGLGTYQKYVYIRNSTDGANIARAVVDASSLIGSSGAQYAHATVTLQGAAESVWVNDSSGTRYYTAGAAKTYYTSGGLVQRLGTAYTNARIGLNYYGKREMFIKVGTNVYTSVGTYHWYYKNTAANNQTLYGVGANVQTVGSSVSVTPIGGTSIRVSAATRYQAGRTNTTDYYVKV